MYNKFLPEQEKNKEKEEEGATTWIRKLLNVL